MININLSVTDAGNGTYADGFGGSAYEQLVAHDNLMSEYIEVDGYYTIPYHAVDSVAITHSSSSHTVTDDLCRNG